MKAHEKTQEQVDIKDLANHMITLTNVLQDIIRDMPESDAAGGVGLDTLLPGDWKRDLVATDELLRELHMRYYTGDQS